MEKTTYKDIDTYIADFPAETADRMMQLLCLIKEIAPEAEEVISYNMPAFKWRKKILVYFAGYKSHIGFYPMPDTLKHFAPQIQQYKHAKGSVQFPLNKPMPLDLIAEMLRFRWSAMLENEK